MGRDLLAVMARFASLGLNLAVEVLAPSRCAACEASVAARALFCTACGVSVMPAGVSPGTDREHAVFDYGGAVAAAIVRFKYAGRSDLAARFAGVMASAARSLRGHVDLVVPVPLHPARLVERGFDQAALLAAPLARDLGVVYAPRALVRARATPPQASLDRAARVANVQGAFVCPSPRSIRDRRVLLVDDVRTTGSTLAACVVALRAAGARDVRTLVLASRDHAAKVQNGAKDEDRASLEQARYHSSRAR